MQSVNFVFEKQEHDCYSQKRVAKDGTLVMNFICPICGPYRRFKKFPDGRTKWERLQKSSFWHSGVSLPFGLTLHQPKEAMRESTDNALSDVTFTV
jgi:hypothetical protein